MAKNTAREHCVWCFTPCNANARVCAGCGSFRKGVARPWQSPREVRRNDMVIAAFEFLLVCALIQLILFLALVLGGASMVKR